MTRHGNTYTPAATRAYEQHVKWSALEAGIEKIDGPVSMTLEIFWPDRRRRDLDNAAKAITDALNGIAYIDDSQIVELILRKRFDKSSPRAEVTITGVDVE
jgi:crossover junction endodeoxyribonuclease RusA